MPPIALINWTDTEQPGTSVAVEPEDFVVLEGYAVPDATFHREFVQDAKSTYPSALCDTLVRRPVALSQVPSSAAGNGSAT